MRKRISLLITTLMMCGATLALAAPAPPQGGPIVSREELDVFLGEMAMLPGSDQDALMQARADLGALPDEAVARIAGTLEAIPAWRDLPAVVGAMVVNEERWHRQQVALAVERSSLAPTMITPDEEADYVRGALGFLVAQLRTLSPIIGEEYDAPLREAEARIATIDAASLPQLKAVIAHYQSEVGAPAPPFQGGEGAVGALSSILEGPVQAFSHTCDHACEENTGDLISEGACKGFCWIFNGIISALNSAKSYFEGLYNTVKGQFDALTQTVTTFISNFGSTITSVFSQITSVLNTIKSAFENLFNSVKSALLSAIETLKANFPTSVSGLVSLLQSRGINLTSFDWNSVASAVPQVPVPCPQEAAAIATNVCERGGEAIAELLFEIAPEDGLGLAIKLGVAGIYFPLSYLCQCAEGQEAIAWAGEEAAHQALEKANLDLQLSTRATLSSVQALSTSLSGLDGNVHAIIGDTATLGQTTGRNLANVNAVDDTADRIEVNTNQTEALADAIQATTDATEALVDRTQGTANTIEALVASTHATTDTTQATANRIDGKLHALLAGNDDQYQFMSSFRDLMTRLNIEDNLLGNAPDAIALYQLPSAFGGLLETVSLIVADTIQMNVNANQNIFGAIRELQRADALRAAGDFVKSYEAYRSAYAEAVK